MTHTITVKISADDEMVKQFGEHRVGVMPTVFFECSEPDDAWCRRNLSAQVREIRARCRATAGSPSWRRLGRLGRQGRIYNRVTHRSATGEIVFTKKDHDEPSDDCTWHYKEDAP